MEHVRAVARKFKQQTFLVRVRQLHVLIVVVVRDVREGIVRQVHLHARGVSVGVLVDLGLGRGRHRARPLGGGHARRGFPVIAPPGRGVGRLEAVSLGHEFAEEGFEFGPGTVVGPGVLVAGSGVRGGGVRVGVRNGIGRGGDDVVEHGVERGVDGGRRGGGNGFEGIVETVVEDENLVEVVVVAPGDVRGGVVLVEGGGDEAERAPGGERVARARRGERRRGARAGVRREMNARGDRGTRVDPSRGADVAAGTSRGGDGARGARARGRPHAGA